MYYIITCGYLVSMRSWMNRPTVFPNNVYAPPVVDVHLVTCNTITGELYEGTMYMSDFHSIFWVKLDTKIWNTWKPIKLYWTSRKTVHISIPYKYGWYKPRLPAVCLMQWLTDWLNTVKFLGRICVQSKAISTQICYKYPYSKLQATLAYQYC